ncbi:MAG TPA: inosine/xanthosine triphosphatase [Candidatus Acidoferrales bacterium]|nr:inosine/xanthosine triphosphatase [Candidatus Acidoferrales bacterium]
MLRFGWPGLVTAKIYVAAGTTRLPKLNAVWEALAVFGPTLDPDAQFELVSVDVPSTVRRTPLTRAETMAGAQGRVRALEALAREQKQRWRYFVGLEGGLDVIDDGGGRRVFLESWACVADDAGRSAWGQSGAILLPDTLAEAVVDRGVDLAEAIDALAGSRGIRDAQGTWGVLSRNLITRQDAFRVAVINAFAPFYNPGLYGG